MDARIAVGGLAQLSRALKAVDKDAPKQLRIGLNQAAQMLVDETRSKIPAVSGAARRSLVARSTRTAGRVAVGGKRAGYYPWLDFGGQGRVKGRPAYRQFLKEGRYIYPALRRIRPQIEASLQESLSTVVRNAGLTED